MRNNLKYLGYIAIPLLLCFLSCKSTPKLSPGEGYVALKEGKVWYRVVGGGEKTPLLLLHGGPGVPSYYLNPMKTLGKDRPVIFFDQLGCGRSAQEIDSSLMTLENYVEQLEELRKGLGVQDFYLYGHSWGTMLGVDYYLRHPDHVKAMILASPALSASRWSEDARELIATLPDSVQTAIETNTANGTFDSADYQHAIEVYYSNFVARKLPWDATIDSALTNANMKIYEYMWGPSEFTPTGTLKDYDRTADLKNIKVPTLFITGEFDEARLATVRYYQGLVPGARLSIIEDAAHLSMHDNPEQNNQVIEDFLNALEK